MAVEYLITIKTLNYKNKKIKKESTKIQNIFLKFQASNFCQKIINIQLIYISCKAFICSIV